MWIADSDIVVMTTEILRNIMYRQEDGTATSQREDRLASVGLVVLDEVPLQQTEISCGHGYGIVFAS